MTQNEKEFIEEKVRGFAAEELVEIGTPELISWLRTALSQAIQFGREQRKVEVEDVYLVEAAIQRGRTQEREEILAALPKFNILDEKVFPYPEMKAAHDENDGYNSALKEVRHLITSLKVDI